MSATAQKFATYEDLFDLPAHIVGEIIHGQLITHPRPAPKQAVASIGVSGQIYNPFHQGRGGPGGWRILFEPELHLVPDLAGWRRERMPELLDVAYFTLPPDWICEVLSPGTARVDRADKMPLYAEYGVSFLWLIDPAPRTLEVFLLREGHWMLEYGCKNDDEVRAIPFDAISFSLADLWS
jgi:Uma2 family endonuclease